MSAAESPEGGTLARVSAAITPGPWYMEDDAATFAILSAHRNGPHDPEVLAVAGEDINSPMDLDELRANARLMAAAPDLRDALLTVSARLAEAEGCPGCEYMPCLDPAEVQAIRAALAKAEGWA